MKNLLLISIFSTVSVFTAQAQNYYYETPSEATTASERSAAERQRRIDNHITGVKVYSSKTDGSTSVNPGTLYSESSYDSKGNTTDFKMYKKNGKLKYRNTYVYNDKNKRTEEVGFKKNGKFEYKYAMTYNDSGNMTEQKLFYHSTDNMLWHSIATFDVDQKMLEFKYLIKNDKKQSDRFVYTYYPDGSRKQTVQYNRKGKIIHTWNYDCNPAGNLAEVKYKDSSKVCIRYETDKDGNKIKIREENVKQGAIVRYVTKYDKNDNPIESTGYDAKGKTRYHYTAKYDDRNNRIEYASYKGKKNKLKEKGIIHYDTSGNITEYTAYKSVADPGKIFKYDYTKGNN